MSGARLEHTRFGLAPAEEGWFAVNVRDAAWVTGDHFGSACIFEGEAVSFPQVGYTLAVLQPGQPSALYHCESDQEDFLVLHGECLAIVEEQERPLRTWDFLHCPGGTRHILVGAGDGPCMIFMAGGRAHPRSGTYVRSEVALRHGASVETETSESQQAYAPFPGWRPGAPSFAGLPFAGGGA